MADITWPMVEAFAAELSVVPVLAQTDILDYVNTVLTVSEFGGEDAIKTKMARIYLAAHYGTITKNGANGPAGAVVAESAGDLSRTYATLSGYATTDPLYDTTPYGKQFRALCRSSRAICPLVT